MEIMKNFGFVAAFLAANVFQACSFSGVSASGNGERVIGSDTYVTKEVRVDAFDEIRLLGSPTVYFVQKAGKPSVKIHTSDNLADLVDVHVEDGTLHVGIKKGCQVRYKKMDIYVTSPTLEAVAVAGSGTMVLTGRLETDALGMSVSGSGDLVGEEVVCKGDVWLSVAGSGDLSVGKVSCRQMEASVSGSGDLAVKEVIAGKAAASVAGSGDLVLSGKAVEADFRVAGSGDLDASCLKAEQAAASVAGSGDLKCYASDCLKARVTGSGSIGYAGNPKGLDISRKNVYPL